MRRITDERGVAMVTVLLVAAVLTVTSTTAAFMTIRELGASTDDLKATRALSYAEAGIDRALLAIRASRWDWNDMVLAGCSAGFPILDSARDTALTGSNILTGSIGSGTYRVVIQRDTGSNACPNPVVAPSPKAPQKLWITSTGRFPAATRRVRQQIEIQKRDLPIGLYAHEAASGGGAGDVTDVSLITPGTIDRREQIKFLGFDKFYTIGDFFPADSDAALGRWLPDFYTNADRQLPIPAAAHAAGGPITETNNTEEHTATTTPNCTFNRNPGEPGQSLWDGSQTASTATLTSGCANWTPAFPNGGTISKRYPPTANFQGPDATRLAPTPRLSREDYEFLKSTAKASGLYCTATTSTNLSNCEGPGTAPNGKTINNGNLPAVGNVVVYIDFPASTSNSEIDSPQRTISWQVNNLPLCSTTNQAANRNVVVVVRNGSFQVAQGAQLSGAVLVPEGTVSAAGGHTTEGTIIARVLNLSGTGTFKMTDCWIQNMSGLFLRVTALKWVELDR